MSDIPAQNILNCTPVVLAGGQSSRFGRNKLLEPVPGDIAGELIVDRPIAALRGVFGARVTLVGRCDSAVVARADRHMVDPLDDRGPLSGIVAALGAARSDVFVLAGDLPNITACAVRTLLAAAQAAPEAHAVLAHSGRLEPCIGLYRLAALPFLEAKLESGRRSLQDALAPGVVLAVPVDPVLCVNINHLHDLSAVAPLRPS